MSRIGRRCLGNMIDRGLLRVFRIHNRMSGREGDLRIALYRLYLEVGQLRAWSFIWLVGKDCLRYLVFAIYY